ncbi:MAG: LptF/LptG family permease, partial [Gammaproteobacteria bacterium]
PVGYKTKTADTLTLYRSDDPDDKAEFQWRISTPISVLLLTILAVPLSRSRPRQGRYAGLVIALLVYALYFNMVTVARTWVEQGSAVSIWWAPGLLALAVLVAYQPWGQWLARLRRKRQHATA